ncbi:MAG TPA: CopD family protein [Candidatus Dormibacteraeota bacterium]|nr:CopD family protein [Candidatus Dormibacteraeota bacterium]
MTFPPPAELAIGGFRWLEYLGLLVFIGVLVVRQLAGNPPRLAWAQLPMQRALALALVGGVGVIVGRALAQGTASAAAAYLLGSPKGWLVVVRVVAEGIAFGSCLTGVRFVVPPGLLACVLLPFGGHAVRVEPEFAGLAVDSLHVLSAGMWAGGIVALATLKPPGGWRAGEGRALLDRFARVAPLAVAITALTGVLRATEELTAVTDLWTTSYGVVLSVKSLGVMVMLALSWLAWRRGLPVAQLEGAIAFVVIAATALLAAYPLTPGEAARFVGLL